jgi:hypothetical protein
VARRVTLKVTSPYDEAPQIIVGHLGRHAQSRDVSRQFSFIARVQDSVTAICEGANADLYPLRVERRDRSPAKRVYCGLIAGDKRRVQMVGRFGEEFWPSLGGIGFRGFNSY